MTARRRPSAANAQRAILHALRARAAHERVPARTLADEANDALVATAVFASPGLRRADVETFLRARPRWADEDERGWRLTDAGRAVAAKLAADGLGFPIEARTPAAAARPLLPWQRDALAAWHAHGRRGIVSAATGAGKTHLGIAAIASHLTSTARRAVVIVPTIDLLEQWTSRLREALDVPVGTAGAGTANEIDEHLVLVCVARTAADALPHAVRRVTPAMEVLLVADECHRYGAETYARALDAPYVATLGLSATPERNHDDGIARYVIPALGEVVYEYEQDRAIGDDVISDFRMLFIGVAFREAEQAAYDALDARIANEWNALAGAYPELATVPKPADGVRLLAGRGGNGDPRADEWLALAAERRRLIAGSSGREDAIAWLAAAGAFAGRRSIVFHESIAECERITTILNAAGVPAAAHHSGLGGEERGTVLERFRTGALRALVAPRTLDEGIDVPDASFALIAAGTRVRRQTIQRIGRVLRKSNDKDLACVVKLFVEGSADDPRARSVDSFTKALARRAGSRIAHFPADERAIASFVTMTAPLPAS